MLAIQTIDRYPPEAIVSSLKAMDEQRHRGVPDSFCRQVVVESGCRKD
ncbi:MAG: hypothetical protein R3C56_19120 [Pirellulaceae bacterium]